MGPSLTCHCGFCGAVETSVEIEPDDLEIGPSGPLLHATGGGGDNLDDQSPLFFPEISKSHLEIFATSGQPQQHVIEPNGPVA